MTYYTRHRGYNEIQGRLHEDSLENLLGGDIQNINDLTQENFRTYDLISSDGIWSVKTHMTAEGKLNESGINAYLADFEHLMGWNRPVGALEEDVKAFKEQIPQGAPIPDVLRKGSILEAVDFLKNHSTLGIPEDHVLRVKEALINRAREYPEIYGLSVKPDEQDLELLSNRIQGTGLKAVDTPALIREQLQRQEINLQLGKKGVAEPAKEINQEEEYQYGYGY